MKESIKNLLHEFIENGVSTKDMAGILSNIDDIERYRKYMDEFPESSRYYQSYCEMEQEAIEDTNNILKKYGIKIIIDSMV